MVRQILVRIIKTLVIFSLLSVSIFGLSQINMDMSTMDSKVYCPFGGHSMSICKMNPMEHIQEWQSMFTMLPAQNVLLALLALFAFLLIRKLHYKLSIPEPPLVLPSNRSAYLPGFQIFDPLKEAFSSGILNPKIF